MNQDCPAEFHDIVLGLLAGDFTRLDPLFDTGSGNRVCPIIRWYEAGCFGAEPQAWAEAFTCACFNGRVEVVQYFLERGIDPSGGIGTGLNAVHWAANRGQVEVVKLLIQHKAPLETRNSYGGTVLGAAVWAAIHEPRGDLAGVVEALLEAGADVKEAEYPSGNDRIDELLRRFGAGKTGVE